MGYYSGETQLFKKDENGVWQHKNCKGKAEGIRDGVELFKRFGSTYLMCKKQGCQSSAEQVIGGETKRSTMSDET